uniref:Phosphoprotein n=1 Tax=Ascaris lumbricoides TaxID=6252 RepID=A0A0M3HZD0_ASCLU
MNVRKCEYLQDWNRNDMGDKIVGGRPRIPNETLSISSPNRSQSLVKSHHLEDVEELDEELISARADVATRSSSLPYAYLTKRDEEKIKTLNNKVLPLSSDNSNNDKISKSVRNNAHDESAV